MRISCPGLLGNGVKLAAGAGALAPTGMIRPAAFVQTDATPMPGGATPIPKAPAETGGVPVDPQLKVVLDALVAFGNPPIPSTTSLVARNLPSLAHALRRVEHEMGDATDVVRRLLPADARRSHQRLLVAAARGGRERAAAGDDDPG